MGKVVRSLPKTWETKVVILEDKDLLTIIYDELRGNLMAYEQNHINRHDNGEKKKVVAFTAETLEIEEESGENNDEGMTHINRRVTQMTRQRRQRPQQDFRIEKFK